MRRSVLIAGTLLLACVLWGEGCYRSVSKDAEPSSRESPPAMSEQGASSSTIATGAEEDTGTVEHPPEEGAAPGTGMSGVPEPPVGLPPVAGEHDAEGVSLPAEGISPSGPEGEEGDGAPATAGSAGMPENGGTSSPGGTATGETVPGTATGTVTPVPLGDNLPGDAPSWAKEKEQLVYRVEFLGLTMGYARFRVRGLVRIGDRQAYHLTVRAWTSDLLAVFYPMNDTIDYYLDVRTLAPIRLEFTKSRKDDDIAFYDQEAGSIVYRYKKNGKVRKKVRAVPGVYDPVSVAYYFRTRELENEEPPRPMYAGRKLWEISARPLGVETVRTDHGRFDTVMIEPMLRRNGTLEHKGNLRVWMTRDERHVPVRLYAKFRKVRTWTLVGELVPDRQGG